MNKNNITNKVILIVLMGFVFSFSILGYLNTSSSYARENKIIKDKNLDLVKETSNFIDEYLKSKIVVVESVAKELQKLDINNRDEVFLSKLNLGKNAGGFADLYLGYESNGLLQLANGDILNIEKDKYDARVRPWYKKSG